MAPLRELIVRAAPGNQRRAIVQAGTLSFPAALGRSGRTSKKREGDGATPIATMRIISGVYRKDRLPRPPQTRLTMKPARPDMLWCDAPDHGCYNRPVKAPFRLSHETMMRADPLYDVCLILDWNISTRKRNCGSAIFFHIARPGYPPTQGCVAISRKDMQRLLPLIGPETVVRVV